MALTENHFDELIAFHFSVSFFVARNSIDLFRHDATKNIVNSSAVKTFSCTKKLSGRNHYDFCWCCSMSIHKGIKAFSFHKKTFNRS